MKVFKILFLLLITVLVPLNAQVTYFTNVSDKQIKTLQVKVAGEMFSDPFIELGGENRIEVNFDAFNPGFGRYAYNLVHCNADWTQSNLSPIEYMNGFKGARSRISPMRWVLRCNTPTTDYFSQTMTFNRRSRGIMPCKYITRMIPPRSYLPLAFLFSSRWLVSPLR